MTKNPTGVAGQTSLTKDKANQLCTYRGTCVRSAIAPRLSTSCKGCVVHIAISRRPLKVAICASVLNTDAVKGSVMTSAGVPKAFTAPDTIARKRSAGPWQKGGMPRKLQPARRHLRKSLGQVQTGTQEQRSRQPPAQKPHRHRPAPSASILGDFPTRAGAAKFGFVPFRVGRSAMQGKGSLSFTSQIGFE